MIIRNCFVWRVKRQYELVCDGEYKMKVCEEVFTKDVEG